MEVYILAYSDYDIYQILGVTTNLQKAEAFVKDCDWGDDDPGTIDYTVELLENVPDVHPVITIWMNKEGTVTYTQKKTYFGYGEDVALEGLTAFVPDKHKDKSVPAYMYDNIMVYYVETKDLDYAIKEADKARLKLLMNNVWNNLEKAKDVLNK